MLENNKLDNLFNQGLSEVQNFNKRDQQWAVVSARLKKKQRPVFIWFVFLLCVISFTGVILQWNSLGTTNKVVRSNVDQRDKLKPSVLIPSDNKDNKDQVTELFKRDVDAEQRPLTLDNIQDSFLLNLSTESKNMEKTLSLYDNTNSNRINTSISNNDKQHTYYYQYNNAPKEHKEIDINLGIKLKELDTSLDSKNYAINLMHREESGIVLSYLERLQLSKLKYDQMIELSIISIENEVVQKLSIDLTTGIFSEFVSADSLIDNQHIGWSAGVNFNFSRFSLGLGYNFQKINRNVSSELSQYNLTDTNFVYGYQQPSSTSLLYNNHLLSLNLGYDLYSYNRFSIKIHSGIFARKIIDGQLRSIYETMDEPLIEETEIENSALELSDVTFGSSVQFELNRDLALSLEYNLIVPLDVDIKWPKRHHLKFGLVYHLYK